MTTGGRKRGQPGTTVWRQPDHPPQDDLLLLYWSVDVKSLHVLGKSYPWPKPMQCPTCEGQRIWGHGYSSRYFEGFIEPLWVKRYRCPDCSAVHTCRPRTYFARYRYPVLAVLMSLLNKVIHGRWLRCISRQNQLPWYRAARAWCSVSQNIERLTSEHLRQYIADRTSGSTQSEPLRL